MGRINLNICASTPVNFLSILSHAIFFTVLAITGKLNQQLFLTLICFVTYIPLPRNNCNSVHLWLHGERNGTQTRTKVAPWYKHYSYSSGKKQTKHTQLIFWVMTINVKPPWSLRYQKGGLWKKKVCHWLTDWYTVTTVSVYKLSMLCR